MLLDNAGDLVEKHIPQPTEAEREQAFLLGVKREIELGWCQIQNAGQPKGRCRSDAAALRGWQSQNPNLQRRLWAGRRCRNGS